MVEQAFACGKIRRLCATSSLALGVNLPARLVIVKGTKTYRGGGSGYQEVDTAQLLQMIGRAGRPGLDTRGTAVILTDNQSRERTERILRSYDAAESSMSLKWVEALNSEISQRVISSVEDAVRWIKTTFYYVRQKKDPLKYGLVSSLESESDDHLFETVRLAIEQLDSIGAITNGKNFISPLAASHIMSQHSVSFEAMKAFADLPFDATQQQILHCISSLELTQFPVRKLEKKFLNQCHQEVRYKIAEPSNKYKVQLPKEKTFLLLQACIGQHYLQDFTLRQEMSSLTDQCSALLTAAHEFSIKSSRNGHVALQCLKLKRSLFACLWGESSGVLNQLPGIGQQCTKILGMNGISSFSDVLKTSNESIGKASGRGRQSPPLTTKSTSHSTTRWTACSFCSRT